jgi:hypothetical protein
VLNHDLIEGKTASELWAIVAPEEPIPEALAQAIERSKNPAPMNEAPVVENARPAGPQFGAPAPAVQTKGEALLSGGYCSNGQFWSQWGSVTNGIQDSNSVIFNYGWYTVPYNSVTSQAEYIVCPQGNVSNLGGVLQIVVNGGTPIDMNVSPDYYVYWVETAGYSCGWDASCGSCNPFPFCQIGGTRCSPQSFNIQGEFFSQCFLDYGSSCGDNFDWISWATFAGSFCAN